MPGDNEWTHWGWLTHMCVSNLTIIGSDNGLSPGQRQAIIWASAGILLIEPLGTNFSEIVIEIHKFAFKTMLLKMSSGKWRPFCLGLNVLTMLGALSYLECFSWLITQYLNYCQTSNISGTKSQNLDVSRLILQLTLPNPLKPSFESRMKM